jgi:hypothetical protein
MVKETEAQTWIRVNENNKSLNAFEIAKLYHSERNKIIAPTDKNIDEQRIIDAYMKYVKYPKKKKIKL